MDFKELTYVIAVSKYQNITKAAESLYLSQPSLSKYIKNLEEYLGIKLFNKVGNKFVLTYAGEIYVENARKILLMKEGLDAQLLDISKRERGRIRIGIPYTRSTYLTPLTLPIFSKKYPNVKVEIIELLSDKLEKLLIEGDLDIAFLNTPLVEKDLNYIKIYDEEILLVLPKNHPLSKKGVKTKKSKYPFFDITTLKDEVFILQTKGQRTRKIADEVFLKNNFAPSKIFETRSLLSGLKLTEVNYGACILLENYILKTTKNSVTCFSLDLKSSDLVVAYRKDAYLSTYALEYIEIAKEVVNS